MKNGNFGKIEKTKNRIENKSIIYHYTIQQVNCVLGYFNFGKNKNGLRYLCASFLYHTMRVRIEKVDIFGWNQQYIDTKVHKS